jgi:HAD superfamily hydrolase (TIGR01509 family)
MLDMTGSMLTSAAIRDIDLVIFDCDGVVVDSEALACACVADTLRVNGLEIGVEEVLDRFLGRSASVIGEHFREVTHKPLPGHFGKQLRDCLAQSFTRSLTPMPHIVDVLKGLNRPYCLASSSDADRIGLMLSVTDLARFFGDRIYNASMVAQGKPAPDLFLFIAGEMKAPGSRVLVIEDSVPGVVAAKAAGMKVWGFTGGSHCAGRDVKRRLLAAGADRVFDSMAEFMDA